MSIEYLFSAVIGLHLIDEFQGFLQQQSEKPASKFFNAEVKPIPLSEIEALAFPLESETIQRSTA